MKGNAMKHGRSIAALMLVLSTTLVSYFAAAVATPVVPLPVYEALAFAPTFADAPRTPLCDARAIG